MKAHSERELPLEKVFGEGEEFQLLSGLLRHLPRVPPEITGTFDDGAIIPRASIENDLVLSVDAFVEGRHFLRELSGPEEIGFKALATASSDICAMGGVPRFALINLQFPRGEAAATLEGCYAGIAQFCAQSSVSIIGGNLSSASELSLSVTVVGQLTKSGALYRNGAQTGDDLWISGSPGLSHLGLLILQGRAPWIPDQLREVAQSRYRRPVPRIHLGSAVLPGIATSCIDVSDGILQDASHLAVQSGLPIEIQLQPLMLPGCDRTTSLAAILGGGDYELLFTAPPSARARLEQLTEKPLRCGTVGPGPGIGAGAASAPVTLRDLDGSTKTVQALLQETGDTSAGYQHR